MTSIALLPLQILLVLIDVLISSVTFGWLKVIQKLLKPEPIRTVPVGDDPSHRVHPDFKKSLITTPRSGATTLYELAQSAFKNHASKVCMRKREFLGWKTKKVKEFGPTVHELTFAQVSEKVHKFGAALRATGGCVSSPTETTLKKVTTPCRIAIFENTCLEWMISALGAFSQSIGVVTVYATLGIDSVQEAINENSIPVIVCNKTNVKHLLENAKNMPSLKVIVYTNDLVAPDDAAIDLSTNPPPNGIQVLSFDEFVASGDTQKHPPTPPAPTSTAVIMYTSGSTGKPKGVVITHASAIAAVAAAQHIVPISNTSENKYLAYLPLAHIMELIVECTVFENGFSLNYADPKSLTTSGSYPTGALEVYAPSHMVAVPKIWDTIKKGLLSKVAMSSSIAQCLVHTAIQWRTLAVKLGLDTPFFNAIVFNKFKKAVGGDLRFALSGGGPLNGKVQEFIRVAFDIPLVQGYGLTESCAVIAVEAFDDERPNVTGANFPSVEIKLVSTPDICDRGGVPYMSTDRHDADGEPIWGRGEIWARGGSITSGYYMMEDKTKEEYTEDGWFKTGDIGVFLKDGSLRIVDRKKNLVKLKSGEYIALEKMEATYGNSKFVDAVAGGICCFGDGDMDRPVAMMQLSKNETMSWAKENGISGDFETLMKSKEVYAAVMDSMRHEHAKSDLSHIEKLQGVALLDSPWTPENGCLTAANKLQRRIVAETFSKELEEVKKNGIFN